MSIIDQFKKKAETATAAAASVANLAVNKSRTAASLTRVRVAVASEEDKLKKAYTEIGRLFYRDMVAQAEADMSEYQPWCDKAADAKANIERLTVELDALKAELRSKGIEVDAETSADATENAEAVPEKIALTADVVEISMDEATAVSEDSEEDTSIFEDSDDMI